MIDRRKLSRLGIAIEGTSKDGGLMLLYSRETDPFILQDIRHSDPDAQLREVDISTLQEAMNRDRDLDLFPEILALDDVKKGFVIFVISVSYSLSNMPIRSNKP